MQRGARDGSGGGRGDGRGSGRRLALSSLLRLVRALTVPVTHLAAVAADSVGGLPRASGRDRGRPLLGRVGAALAASGAFALAALALAAPAFADERGAGGAGAKSVELGLTLDELELVDEGLPCRAVEREVDVRALHQRHVALELLGVDVAERVGHLHVLGDEQGLAHPECQRERAVQAVDARVEREKRVAAEVG